MIKSVLFFLAILTFLIGCTNKNRKVENLQTFAKVYGYVRWFYPSDEVTKVDWDKFAVYGVKKVENAGNENELKQILIDLFNPIAPALEIETSIASKFSVKSITPKDTAGLLSVSWMHYGAYLGKESNIYKSIRINRDMIDEPCLQYIINDISKCRSKEVKLTISYKMTNLHTTKAYLNLSSENHKIPTSENSRSIISPTNKWKDIEKIIIVKKSDDYLKFGINIDNPYDTLWIRNVRITVKENSNWVSVPIFNQNFEEGLVGWNCRNFLFEVKGNNAKCTKNNEIKFFPSTRIPKIGDYFQAKIGNNLIVTMPIALYADQNKTWPISDSGNLRRLLNSLDSMPSSQLNTTDEVVRIANVVITWNVLQHFYPYFDVVKVDWEKELLIVLNNVYAGKTEIEYYKTLCKMMASLNDGHGRVFSLNIKRRYLPIIIESIENKVVISKSYSPYFLKGDIILEIDGKDCEAEIREQENLISGSPQYKHVLALKYFGSDFSPNYAHVILLRAGKKIELEIQRTYYDSSFDIISTNFADLGNGNFYIGSNNLSENEINSLSTAKSIIVGEVYNKWSLLPHIISKSVISPRFCIPLTTLPDRSDLYFEENSRWIIEPRQPTIKAKLVFIVHSYDISSNETFLAIIDHYKLGKLVGETSGGTNGNINTIPLMGGYKIIWTGMKVLNYDDTQIHLKGFQPDYYVQKTIKAFNEYRDEYIEKAKEILKE